MMQIECKREKEITVLEIFGEIDMATVDMLIERAENIYNNGKSKLILDFANVKFVDSTGVGKLIRLFQDYEDIELVITNLQPDIKEIFEILNLKEILGDKAFFTSNQEAISFLKVSC